MKEYDDFFYKAALQPTMSGWRKTNPPCLRKSGNGSKRASWVIVGGWWIQPDCNAPGGESYVRQGLYGQPVFSGEAGE